MSKITITLPDNSKKKFDKGVTGLEIARSIGERLARASLAISVNGELYDLFRKIETDANIVIHTFDSKEGKHVFWHSTAHVLAQAVLRLWPDVKPTIGPTIETGFYYDFFKDEPFTPSDLEKIEAEMKKIIKENHEVTRKVVKIKDAQKQFKHNKFKLELIDDFSKQSDDVTVYSQGEFHDLCRGGHAPFTGYIKAFKLTKVSSAYWRGDQSRESLQRIYGVSFPEKKQLKEYVHLLEEAEKRDHRKIGSQMDLFMFHEFSPGSPFFLPKGTFIYQKLVELIRSQYKKRNYVEVITPQIFSNELWQTSGHWQHYRENMFLTKADSKDYALKPMNCPGHCLMFSHSAKSYRDLPLRVADFSFLHRNELRGTLGGLTRVRRFATDDSHIFCTLDQIQDEIIDLLDFVDQVYGVFGFDFHVELSTKPEKSLGTEKEWDIAEKALENAMEKAGKKYKLNPGDGAFYGPKLDFHIKDALGRTWQCATIQIDFNQPDRFTLQYDGEDGKKHNPVIIHKAILGSVERFMAVLIEHYAGKFPLWINPNQVIVLPIADRHKTYAELVASKIRDHGVRCDVDESAETTNKKIRNAQLSQYNYILVVGDKEVKNETVNVRTRDEKVHGEKSVTHFSKELEKEVKEKK